VRNSEEAHMDHLLALEVLAALQTLLHLTGSKRR